MLCMLMMIIKTYLILSYLIYCNFIMSIEVLKYYNACISMSCFSIKTISFGSLIIALAFMIILHLLNNWLLDELLRNIKRAL